MKFKVRNILLVSFLAIAGFFGVSSTLINKQVNEQPVAEKAEASSTDAVYLVGSFNGWNHSDSNYKMTWLPGQNKWFFTRTFSSGESFGFDYNGTWVSQNNGAVNQKKISDTVIFEKDNGNNWQCKSAGTYIVYCGNEANNYIDKSFALEISQPIVQSSTPSASASTYRVWVRADFGWWYNDYAATAVKVSVGESDTYYIMNNILNEDDSLYYWYIDVPTNTDGIQFVRLALDHATIYNMSVYLSSIGPTGVYYIKDRSGDYYENRDVDWDTVVNPSVAFFAKVLEAYVTCSDSTMNGYGAYSNLKTKWYDHLTAEEQASLSSTLISDYSYSDYHNAGDSYSGISKNTTVTLQEKWTALSNMTTSGNPNYAAIRTFSPLSFFGDNEESNIVTVVIIAASSVALLSVTALSILVIKKRKNKEE